MFKWFKEKNQNQRMKGVRATTINELDDKVAEKMGLKVAEGKYRAIGSDGFLDIPPAFSSNPFLVNDMKYFAKVKGIKLPLFTSNPKKIAKAIANWEEK